MIVFDLRCEQAHLFEAWFDNSIAYEAQKDRGLLSCPVCGTKRVEKAVMAPAVGAKGNRLNVSAARAAEAETLKALRTEIETNCDYVGRRFSFAARERFEQAEGSDRPLRGIYGEASLAEAVELLADGIAIAPLPFRPRRLADA